VFAGLVSLALITAILWWALRALRLVAIALLTLLVGLAWTAGFATLAVGSLNLISVAFAVLFVSLGIDFSIHVCLRVAEASAHGADPRRAVREGTAAVAGSLGLCAASTAVGFYAFLPTTYRGVSELGLIAGTGMILALAANLSVLPALLTLWPGRGRNTAAPVVPALRLPRRAVLGGAGLALLAAAVTLPWARFDFNPLNLQDPEAESVAVLRTLMAEGERDLWAAASVAGTAEEAAARARAFETLDVVDRAVWLGSFVPSDQEARLEIVRDIASVNEPDLFAAPYPEPTAAEQHGAVASLARALERLQSAGPVPDGVGALARALDRLEAAPPAALEPVEEGLVGALPGRLAALEEAARAEPFAIADLPADLVARFRGEDGSFRIDIHPAEDIAADNEALERFVTALRAVDRDVTDDPVIVLEAGRVVVGAFAQALLSALALIALILYVVTRRLGDVFAALVPLCLAAVLTGAATVVLGLAFNFANVIVLPLLLGIGVDSAIHLIHRHRTDPGRPVLGTSTARAVLFSALTTVAGFGSLALSPHLGTASMGRLLLIGVTLTTACTLVVVPALLSSAGRGAAR
jgi:hopanoid biosynthesis associated RND transporter like protein HpnN